MEFFQKIDSFKNISLGHYFLKQTFFSNFNFWTTLFSKIMPNFWQTVAPRILKIQWFPLSTLIFGQKSYFLGPTIFKIPQPNWHSYIEHKNAIKGGFASLLQCTLYFSDEKAVFQGHFALGSLKPLYSNLSLTKINLLTQ